MKSFPLEIMNVGEDTYMLMSWGHHDFNEFMEEVRENYPSWPMGNPTHEWYVMHPNKGYQWAAVPCDKNHPKARPATVSVESY